MATLKGSRTHENLKVAFSNEAQANRRYLYFARQADVEGFPEIAGLFRDTAEGEAGHAHGHLDHLRKVGDPVTGMPIGTSPANLEAAIAGETFEYTELYPGMAATAREEGFAEIADWFECLAKAERNHAARFRRGMSSLREIGKELQVR
jgi:rubrerythrin